MKTCYKVEFHKLHHIIKIKLDVSQGLIRIISIINASIDVWVLSGLYLQQKIEWNPLLLFKAKVG